MGPSPVCIVALGGELVLAPTIFSSKSATILLGGPSAGRSILIVMILTALQLTRLKFCSIEIEPGFSPLQFLNKIIAKSIILGPE